MSELTHDQIVELSKHPFRCAQCRQWFDDGEPESLCEKCEYVEAIHVIRAFVERVEKRIEKIPPYQEADTSRNAMKAELALMEAEVKE
jgi:hypothetical protein